MLVRRGNTWVLDQNEAYKKNTLQDVDDLETKIASDDLIKRQLRGEITEEMAMAEAAELQSKPVASRLDNLIGVVAKEPSDSEKKAAIDDRSETKDIIELILDGVNSIAQRLKPDVPVDPEYVANLSVLIRGFTEELADRAVKFTTDDTELKRTFKKLQPQFDKVFTMINKLKIDGKVPGEALDDELELFMVTIDQAEKKLGIDGGYETGADEDDDLLVQKELKRAKKWLRSTDDVKDPAIKAKIDELQDALKKNIRDKRPEANTVIKAEITKLFNLDAVPPPPPPPAAPADDEPGDADQKKPLLAAIKGKKLRDTKAERDAEAAALAAQQAEIDAAKAAAASATATFADKAKLVALVSPKKDANTRKNNLAIEKRLNNKNWAAPKK